MDNNLYFTKEQFEMLYDAEIHFKSARRGGYIKNVPRWLTDKVADIWEERTGQKVNRNWSCNTCVLNFYNLVGKYYLQDKEIYEREPKEEPVEVFTESVMFNVVEQPENNEQPKRKGRPKKTE